MGGEGPETCGHREPPSSARLPRPCGHFPHQDSPRTAGCEPAPSPPCSDSRGAPSARTQPPQHPSQTGPRTPTHASLPTGPRTPGSHPGPPLLLLPGHAAGQPTAAGSRLRGLCSNATATGGASAVIPHTAAPPCLPPAITPLLCLLSPPGLVTIGFTHWLSLPPARQLHKGRRGSCDVP